jgi:hypothetical protein
MQKTAHGYTADDDHKSHSFVKVHFNMDFAIGVFVIVKLFSYRFSSGEKRLMVYILNRIEQT